MRIHRIDITHLRSLQHASIYPSAGFNFIVGDNGVGKTTLLEAIYLFSYGRSFRGRNKETLIKTGADQFNLYIEWTEAGKPITHKAGIQQGKGEWRAKLDGEPVELLKDLCSQVAVVCFEPGSHALIDGASEHRRRFLDWALFHAEPGFLHEWRRYNRALKQRNALLKQKLSFSEIHVWDRELSLAGESITRYRQRYVESLNQLLSPLMPEIAPSLGVAELHYIPGWRKQDQSLADALLTVRQRDLQLGYTSVGPHRANWQIFHEQRPAQETLSRGQSKLTALTCFLAQAKHYAERKGAWPVVLLDDLQSELDKQHQARVMQYLSRHDVQVFITGTDDEIIKILPSKQQNSALFHVEQNTITPVD